MASESDVPKLTDVQKLLLLNAVKDVQIAKLKFDGMVKDLQRDGWELDLETMTYREKVAKP